MEGEQNLLTSDIVPSHYSLPYFHSPEKYISTVTSFLACTGHRCTPVWDTSSHTSNENNCVSAQEKEGTEAGETWVKKKHSGKSFPIPLWAPPGFMVTATALLQHIIHPHKDVFSHYA